MINHIKGIFISICLLFFSGCMISSNDVKSALQTNSANIIKKDYESINSLLIDFKGKLDKRNPNTYSKKLESRIYKLIKNLENNLYVKYENNTLENYKDYLQIAFSKDDIFPRNDYLILGLYYLIHSSYDIEDGHRVTALEYDSEKLNKLYKNLQIIKWKLKVDKDFGGNYLFLTWQNNWQIQLEKKLKSGNKLSVEELEMLESIKMNKESMLDPSNFSFEVILTQMIDKVKNSLEALGEEPKKLSVTALRSMFLFF